ncbi:MAG TPA: TonB-dependent siderophore receptor, partial [Allosphingosinicella sp.]
VVTGQREEYGVKSTRTGTRTDTEIKDIPQAMTVISEAQIEDQALRSIADVLTYVPGAMPGTGEGNRDQITLRGNNTTADFFVDGIRDDVQYFRDLYNVDRVEILRGPNAMIFGRGGGGGIVNRVTKRSSLNAYREGSISADSEGGFRLTADVDQPLGASAGVRLNGVYEDGESFRRGVDLERYGVNPTVGFLLGPDTRLDLSYEFFHDRRTADRGVPSLLGRPLKGADRVFFGDPRQSFADADVHLAGLAFEHRFSDALTLRNRTLYGDYDKFYQNIYPSGAVNSAGNLTLSAYNDATRRKNVFSQTDLVWKGRLGGVDQTFLLGFELGHQDSRQRRLNGFFVAGDSASITVPAAQPTVSRDMIFLPFNTTGGCRPSNRTGCTPANFNHTDASILAVYAQDQIRLGMVEIVAGLRFDRFRLEATNLNNNAEFTRTDELFSPRIGLILKPTDALSFYASYSRSYLPSSGDQFSSLDITSEALKPEKFDNYEVGAKWEPLPGLLATFAAYQLDRTNTRAPDPANPARTVLTGAQRSRGIEVGLERNISDQWQISAGYSHQKAEIRSRTTACNPAVANCEVPLVPRHQFSLWNRYDFTKKLGLGLGIVARSKAYASISNAVTLPGYVRVDAAAYYEIA